MNKTKYTAPACSIVKVNFVSHLMDNSPLTFVTGADGITTNTDEFGGGAADVKSGAGYNVWDDDWSR